MDYAAQLAQFSRILEQKGYFTALEGNASILDRESGRMYITPSGRMKLLLQPDDICVLNADGEQIAGCGKRSSEYLLHEAAYLARPDACAVIHSHCPYLTAYALRGEDFYAPERTSLQEIFAHIVCLPYGKRGTHEIHQGIEDALRESRLCLLGGHGVVCVADTMEACVGYLNAAEGFAKTLFLAKHM